MLFVEQAVTRIFLPLTFLNASWLGGQEIFLSCLDHAEILFTKGTSTQPVCFVKTKYTSQDDQNLKGNDCI